MSAHVKRMFQKAASTLQKNNGQGLVEYALILALVAIVVLAALTGIGKSSNTTFSTINSAITEAN